MENKIFKNKWTLSLNNDYAEKLYHDQINSNLSKYLKYALCIPLILIITEFIFFKYLINTNQINELPWIINFSKLSLCNMILIILFTLISLFNKKIIVLKLICYLSYLISVFPILTLDLSLSIVIKNNNYTRFIFYVNITIRLIVLFTPLVSYIDFLILMILHLIITFSMRIILNYPFNQLIFTFIEASLYYIVIYLFTKQRKSSLLSFHLIKDKVKMYDNLIKHLNFGYFSINSNKINKINKSLYEMMFGYTKFKDFINNNNLLINEDKQLKSNYEKYIIENSEYIINNLLLSNIYEDYLFNGTTIQTISNSLNISEILMKKYKEEAVNNEFLFIGYKDLETEFYKCKNCLKHNIIMFCEKCESSENSILSKELKNYEIHYRTLDNNEIEFIFNDITNIKYYEARNADLKYKTLYLSKVAHEFKNPLICISELVNKIDKDSENFYNEISNLKYISEYLLLLIKDLDYFSNMQVKDMLPELELEDININDIFDICNKIANVLISRYDKKNIIYKSNISIGSNYKLISDSTKIKQILINLISNSIKFTTSGFVSLNIFFSNSNLKFEIEDSGIGMNEYEILKIKSFTPFCKTNNIDSNRHGSGLGFFIVNSILKQLDSDLEIISSKSKGTLFSFQLKLNENSYISYSTIAYKGDMNINHMLENSIHNINLNIQNINNESNDIHGYIIIADDEVLTRKSTTRLMENVITKSNIGIKLLEVDDGIECLYNAYNIIKSGKILKGIISDESMIYMNGSTSAGILRKLKCLNVYNTKICIITAYNNFSCEYADFIYTKPFSLKKAEKFLDGIIT